jgi:hypothetical protein
MGPFQMTVCVVSRAALNVAIESEPISSPIQPSGIADAGTTYLKISWSGFSFYRTERSFDLSNKYDLIRKRTRCIKPDC